MGQPPRQEEVHRKRSQSLTTSEATQHLMRKLDSGWHLDRSSEAGVELFGWHLEGGNLFWTGPLTRQKALRVVDVDPELKDRRRGLARHFRGRKAPLAQVSKG
jgi:hypothetical protein